MAKGTGLIGNFKGKVGNMVGYNLKDSNNKQTQGIRVYQPVVRNPKSYAQAQQRCIMKPINDFYRALKPVISRGQEGKAYGNASRLAWLKNVMKDFNGPWLEKGSTAQWPIACPITKGSLPTFPIKAVEPGAIVVNVGASVESTPQTIAELYAALLTTYPSLEEGDQVTIVKGLAANGVVEIKIDSFVMSSTDNTPVDGFDFQGNVLAIVGLFGEEQMNFGTIIVSREAANGGHLRSTQEIVFDTTLAANDVYDAASSKPTAIASYMAAGANTDWPQEALEG